jgi:hypothetical protein
MIQFASGVAVGVVFSVSIKAAWAKWVAPKLAEWKAKAGI